MKFAQLVAVLGTLLMLIGAVTAVIAGPVWLAVVLSSGALCGLAGVMATHVRS
ncbi:hypothetical protein [Streptomyces sp. NPDC007346]|uniref:hypothetical protein n=1 Tax=Streptomyces sp. NPDC007346 TaxID=3154682 RepID=UPI0034533FA6